jgi:hypothetical protein
MTILIREQVVLAPKAEAGGVPRTNRQQSFTHETLHGANPRHL